MGRAKRSKRSGVTTFIRATYVVRLPWQDYCGAGAMRARGDTGGAARVARASKLGAPRWPCFLPLPVSQNSLFPKTSRVVLRYARVPRASLRMTASVAFGELKEKDWI